MKTEPLPCSITMFLVLTLTADTQLDIGRYLLHDWMNELIISHIICDWEKPHILPWILSPGLPSFLISESSSLLTYLHNSRSYSFLYLPNTALETDHICSHYGIVKCRLDCWQLSVFRLPFSLLINLYVVKYVNDFIYGQMLLSLHRMVSLLVTQAHNLTISFSLYSKETR